VWGQLRTLDHVLRDGDRVEVYRELLIDPKDARRLRHRGQRQAKR
jgi:putative ubiquitin-RnfH superfamily antitoxin RatB of RatAB toxin-antitoxin module